MYLFTEVVSATEGSYFLLFAVSFLGHSHLQYRIQYSTVQYSTAQYLSIRDDVKSVARGSLPDNVVA